MKKLLSIATLLGALAGAASAAPYVLPSPQPGALTPYDAQPVYAIEGLYGIAQDSDLPDTYGVRGSFNIYSAGEGTFRHQWSINVGALWGSDDLPVAGYIPATTDAAQTPTDIPALKNLDAELDLFMLPITFGYTLNISLSDSVMLYVGGKAGAAWTQGELSVSGTTEEGKTVSASEKEDTFGFTYSVGAGLKIQCSDSTYVHAGYEFGRTYLDLDNGSGNFIYGAHTISLGVGCQF